MKLAICIVGVLAILMVCALPLDAAPFTSPPPMPRAAAPHAPNTFTSPLAGPLCPGSEPNDSFDTALALVAPATWLDSFKYDAPEQDVSDVWKLPSSATVTQTLSLISQGPDSDPLYLLVWFNADGVRQTFRIVDDLDKTRCAAGEFWMCTARASFVWERTEQLYAEVYMLGTKKTGCLYYRLDYQNETRPVTATPTPSPTPTVSPTATATPRRVYLPLVVR
jgi:hypothetical protein